MGHLGFLQWFRQATATRVHGDGGEYARSSMPDFLGGKYVENKGGISQRAFRNQGGFSKREMDCRVKPGNDGLCMDTRRLALARRRSKLLHHPRA